MNTELEEAHWHHSAGREFQEAFYLLIVHFSVSSNSWRKQVDRPSFYCGGLAIEHFLKCYFSLEKIRFPKNHKGHDLMGLISLSREKVMIFFELDDTELEQVHILNERYYSHKNYGKDDLRYANKSGFRLSPHPDNLNRIIMKMERKLIPTLQQKLGRN